MGFGRPPRPEYVFIDQDKSPKTGWYTLDYSGPGSEGITPVPIPHSGLTGYLTRVDEYMQEYRGEEKRKIQFHVQAGPRLYVIRTGFTTTFSRSLLGALAKLQPEHFKVPLCIEISMGKEAKTTFATLYNASNGRTVKSAFPREDQVDDLYNKVVSSLGQSVAAVEERPLAAVG